MFAGTFALGVATAAEPGRDAPAGAIPPPPVAAPGEAAKSTVPEADAPVEVRDAGSAAPKPDGARFGVGAMYLPFDLLLPSKIGAGVFYRQTSRGSFWELDYQRGSVSLPFLDDRLGGVTESRVVLRRAMMLGESGMYFGAGAAYFDFSAEIGNALLSRLPGAANVPTLNLLRQRSLGFHLALGTEFRPHENWRLMVDWLTWSQPVIGLGTSSAFLDAATNADDRDAINGLLTVLKYVPRAGALGVRVAYFF